jgi:phosphoribosylformylglycinamidine synthase
LISALGQVDDVAQCVSMDLKQPGDRLYLVGLTRDELGGSHAALAWGAQGGQVPRVDPEFARRVFAAVHRAIGAGCVRACHDLSEGGLAAAAAEMALAGDLGVELRLDAVPHDLAEPTDAALLFAESNSRFLCEVPADRGDEFASLLQGVPCAELGVVVPTPQVTIRGLDGTVRIDLPCAALRAAWLAPLSDV